MPRRGPYDAKAVRLGRALAGELRAGRYAPGVRLPSETALAAQHRCARATIRRALALLESERLVRRVPHGGVIVLSGDAAPPRVVRPAIVGRPVIAAIAAAEPNESIAQLHDGIADYAREHGLDFHVIAGADDPRDPFAAIDHAEDLGLHGVIIVPHPGDERRDVIDRLCARRFPVVCVERRSAALRVPSVEVDNRGGMRRAVQHLLALHRRPVWYLGMTAAHRADQERYEGYRRAMIEAGYGGEIAARTVLHEWTTADPRYWHVDEPWRQGLEIGRRLLASGDRFWSVACQKDDIAWGLYRACAERGLAVGRQVAITGFDDLTIAARLDPPLTTVRQPWREKGAKAAWLLARTMRSGVSAPIEVTVPVDLVVRASSGDRSRPERSSSRSRATTRPPR